VNRRWNGFYKNTFDTIRDAWIRPRHAGYVEFQSEGSDIIRGGLRTGESITKVLQSLQDAYARYCLIKNSSDINRKA
jgi:multiple sugar transport system substrate-binding protein